MHAVEPAPMAAPVRTAEPMPAAEPIRPSQPASVEPAAAPAPSPRVAEPARPAPPPAVPRPLPSLPPVALELPPDSNLQLVETRFKPAPVPEAEPELPVGPRRVRPPRVEVREEPLQIVETRKGDQPPAG